jgi:REP element-mobilizing transposase RayT
MAVTPPRQIHPGQLCFITVRAVNRCYRFAPTRQALDIIWYCLARTLDKYSGCIEAHEFLWMSNHYHLVLTDRGGRLPRFMEELNSLLARALNALHGIEGTTIEKGYNLVAVATDGKLVEHCVYTLSNPCKANLVERSHQWQGVSSQRLEYGVGITVERPRHGLWGGQCRHVQRSASQASKRARYGGRSKLPEKVTLVLTRPPIMPELSDSRLRSHIREQLRRREHAIIEDRRSRKLRVVGWNAATKVSVRAAPKRTEERFGTVPSYSADTNGARISAWNRRREFLERYYAALRRFVSGEWAVAFPAGTWLMKVRFGVTCCPLPAT